MWTAPYMKSFEVTRLVTLLVKDGSSELLLLFFGLEKARSKSLRNQYIVQKIIEESVYCEQIIEESVYREQAYKPLSYARPKLRPTDPVTDMN